MVMEEEKPASDSASKRALAQAAQLASVRRRIFVQCALGTDLDALQRYFGQFGSAAVAKSTVYGSKLGVIVDFTAPEDAQKALAANELHAAHGYMVRPFQGGAKPSLNAAAKPFAPARQQPDSMDVDGSDVAPSAVAEQPAAAVAAQPEEIVDDDDEEAAEESDENDEEEQEGAEGESDVEDEGAGGGDDDDDDDNEDEEEAAQPRMTTTTTTTSSAGEDEPQSGECVVGTCTAMCPASEVASREPDLLEMPHPAMPQLPAELMVKRLTRSSANQVRAEPEDVRTVEALDRTAGYLWREILDIDSRGPDPRFAESQILGGGDHATPQPGFVYGFVCDRSRQVRKDFAVQGMQSASADMPFSPVAVKVFEECVRFHIGAGHEFCEGGADGYVDQLNRKELNDALKSLRELYPRGRALGHAFSNEAEMNSYYLLLNLQTNDRLAVNMYVAGVVAELPDVADHPLFTQALDITQAYLAGDFYTFFSLLRSDDVGFLTACLMHTAMPAARMQALAHLGQLCRREVLVPLGWLRDLLCFDDDDDVAACLKAARVAVRDDAAVLLRKSKSSDVAMDFGVPRRVSKAVMRKRGSRSRGEIVADPSRTGRAPATAPLQRPAQQRQEQQRQEQQQRNAAVAAAEAAERAKAALVAAAAAAAAAAAEQRAAQERKQAERDAAATAEAAKAEAEARAQREAEARRQQHEAARLRAAAEEATRAEAELRAREERRRQQAEAERARAEAERAAQERARVAEEAERARRAALAEAEARRAAREAAVRRQRAALAALETRKRQERLRRATAAWKQAADASATLRNTVRVLAARPQRASPVRSDDADLPLDAGDAWAAPLPHAGELLDAAVQKAAMDEAAAAGVRVLHVHVSDTSTSVRRFAEWARLKLQGARGERVRLVLGGREGCDGVLELADGYDGAAMVEVREEGPPAVVTLRRASREALARALVFLAERAPDRAAMVRRATVESLALRAFPAFTGGSPRAWLRAGNAALRRARAGPMPALLRGWPPAEAYEAMPDALPPPDWAADGAMALGRCAVPECDDVDAFCAQVGVSWLAQLRDESGGDDDVWLWNRACAAGVAMRARPLGSVWCVQSAEEPRSLAAAAAADAPSRVRVAVDEPAPAASPLAGAELRAAQRESEAFARELAVLVRTTEEDDNDAPAAATAATARGPRSLKRALEDAWRDTEATESRLKVLLAAPPKD